MCEFRDLRWFLKRLFGHRGSVVSGRLGRQFRNLSRIFQEHLNPAVSLKSLSVINTASTCQNPTQSVFPTSLYISFHFIPFSFLLYLPTFLDVLFLNVILTPLQSCKFTDIQIIPSLKPPRTHHRPPDIVLCIINSPNVCNLCQQSRDK